MGFIFDFLGSIFGYILWFFFDAVSNYGLAILIFTLIVNIIMFPVMLKSRKSMAASAKLSSKQMELKKKFGNDQKKYNEELAKLYEKEGVNPMKGCLTSFLPLIILSGVIGAINRPLKNTLHIPQEKIASSVEMISKVPGIGSSVSSNYQELEIVRMYPQIKEHLTMFNEEELADIEEYSSGFDFCGMNLLDRPNQSGFKSTLWIIPLLCFLGQSVSMFIAQKLNGTQPEMQGQGCMKIMPYGLALFTAYIAYTTPGAVGLYWVIGSMIGIIQNLIFSKYYNAHTLNAKAEAERVALLEILEKDVREIKNPNEVK